jgi:chromosome segregation ATPase
MSQIEELRNQVAELSDQVAQLTAAMPEGQKSRAVLEAEADARIEALRNYPEYIEWEVAYDELQTARINNGSKTALERLWKALDGERMARVDWNTIQKRMLN